MVGRFVRDLVARAVATESQPLKDRILHVRHGLDELEVEAARRAHQAVVVPLVADRSDEGAPNRCSYRLLQVACLVRRGCEQCSFDDVVRLAVHFDDPPLESPSFLMSASPTASRVWKLILSVFRALPALSSPSVSAPMLI